jgi:hypothetical protein
MAHRASRLAAVLGLLAVGLLPATGPASAAVGPTMEARIMLGGHVRIGSWMAISVHLANDGPAVIGELRMKGGTQGQTRFGVAVDLPTQSDKTYTLYAQPPAFGSQLEVDLVDGDRTVASAKPTFTSHDASQLVVGIVAERPEGIVGSLHLLPNVNQVAPLVVDLAPEDLPDRVEAWSGLDRIIWQDVDSERLTPAQVAALRGWVAGGGRLIVTGGTAGPRSLSAFPDELLPYRPLVTADVPAANLAGLLGKLPATATTLPALSGTLAAGSPLAAIGDQVVAAERSYGAGVVTLLGFDPTVDWIAKTDTADVLWRGLLPPRTGGGLTFTDDGMLVSAVSQLPSLALPPIGGLIALLVAYILLIGPINYLVLRRLDKREWAWLTMPALIVLFAVGAYAFGAALRGSELIVNEVAVVRGAPGASDGTAQVYLGVFSPSRGTFQVQVPGGALLSAPSTGDVFGGTGTGSQLDVLQGDPARVRDLAVGFGSLRTIRAETAVSVPVVQADLRLADGHLRGTIRNTSAQRLENPAVVLGGTVAILGDLEPGAEAAVDVALQTNLFGQSLSDRVVGQLFYGDGFASTDASRLSVRHSMVDQLTYDPMFGSTNQLPDEGPVILAWGSESLVPVDITDQTPRRLGNVLYYLPATMTISGTTTFRNDLIRSSVIQSDAAFFNKDPYSINFGRGTATVAYRPTGFNGTLTVSELAIGLNFGGDISSVAKPTPVEPLASIPPTCPNPPTADCGPAPVDGLPEIELFDATNQAWVRLPHLSQGSRYAVADPTRYVDPTSGSVLVRYVNDRMDNVGFSVDLSITGDVR